MCGTVNQLRDGKTDLVATGQPVGQILQAAHHPLVPEVVREGFRPLRQQLEDLGGDLPHPHLMEEGQTGVRKTSVRVCVCVCASECDVL